MAERLHLSIPEPCHENWNQMTPNEQGRHCLSCQKTVVDFTLMSDQEIVQYLSSAKTSVCGRFTGGQLSKAYQLQRSDRPFSFRYAWSLLVSTFLLLTNEGKAQAKQSVATQVDAVAGRKASTQKLTSLRDAQDKQQENWVIKGVVLDADKGESIPGATIMLKGTSRGVVADEQGIFQLKVDSSEKEVTLVASWIGYKTREIKVSQAGKKKVRIRLSMDDVLTGDVIVVGEIDTRE